MQILADENGNIIQTASMGDIGGEQLDLSLYKMDESGNLLIDVQKVQERQNAARKAEILKRLNEIDFESIRPLRAVLTETAEDYDRTKLEALENEAKELRTELGGLNAND